MVVAVLWSRFSANRPVWELLLVGVAAPIRKVVKLRRDQLQQVESTRAT
jgi:hypothetical protein